MPAFQFPGTYQASRSAPVTGYDPYGGTYNYNPLQWADPETAQGLGDLLGMDVGAEQMAGGYGYSAPKLQLSRPGMSGSLDAGLVADSFNRYAGTLNPEGNPAWNQLYQDLQMIDPNSDWSKGMQQYRAGETQRASAFQREVVQPLERQLGRRLTDQESMQLGASEIGQRYFPVGSSGSSMTAPMRGASDVASLLPESLRSALMATAQPPAPAPGQPVSGQTGGGVVPRQGGQTGGGRGDARATGSAVGRYGSGSRYLDTSLQPSTPQGTEEPAPYPTGSVYRGEQPRGGRGYTPPPSGGGTEPPTGGPEPLPGGGNPPGNIPPPAGPPPAGGGGAPSGYQPRGPVTGRPLIYGEAGGIPGANSPYQNWRYSLPEIPEYRGVQPYTGGDITEMARSDRNLAIGRGDELNQNIGNYGRYERARGADYEDRLWNAFEAIARGEGGYSPEEQEQILREAELYGLKPGADARQRNFLTESEQTDIRGYPHEIQDRLFEGSQSLDALGKDRGDRTRQATGNLEGRLRDDYLSRFTNAMRAAEGTQYDELNRGLERTSGNIDNALTYQDAAVRQALDRERGETQGALSYGEQTANAAIDPNALSLSPEFNRDYAFTDADVRGTMDKAARNVRAGEQSAVDRIDRDLYAAGTTDPLARATAIARQRRTGDITSADAMTDARLRARQQQMDAQRVREEMRLNAARDLSSRKSSTALELGGRRINAAGTLGAAERGAEQGLSASRLASEQYKGNLGTGIRQYTGSSRLDTERAIGEGTRGIESEIGQTNLTNERDLNNSLTDTQKWITDRAVQNQKDIDAANSARAMSIAGNRQQTERTNQDTDYSQGLNIYDRAAGANKGFADTRMGQEGEYRQYLGGQQGQASQNTNVANQQQVGIYGQQMGAQQGATGNAIRNYAVPGAVEKGLGILGGFLADGGVVDGPTTALVGEEGPEMLVNLDGAPMPRAADGMVASPTMTTLDYEGGYYGKPMTGQATSTATTFPESKPYQPNNPLWKQILAETFGIPIDVQGAVDATGATPANTKKPQSGILRKLIGASMGVPMADGGVVAPPYASEYIGTPQVRSLGVEGPQAVVPLTPRPDAAVTPDDIPQLMEEFGGAPKGMANGGVISTMKERVRRPISVYGG
jgi:hypothetical protein